MEIRVTKQNPELWMRHNAQLRHDWLRWWARIREDYVPEYVERHSFEPTRGMVLEHTRRFATTLLVRDYGGWRVHPDWMALQFPEEERRKLEWEAVTGYGWPTGNERDFGCYTAQWWERERRQGR